MPYLYFNINVCVTIADKIQFNVIKSIQIESTIEKLSDTAKIELPREFKNAILNKGALSLEKKNLLEYIKVGDSILIEAGYDGDLQTEFEGYITEIGAEIPTVLQCEDEMYKLRKADIINHTFSSVTLKQLLQFIAPGYEIETNIDRNLGKFTISRLRPYEVLEKLKEYNIKCFFKGKKLHAGLLVDLQPQTMHQFNFKRNIRSSSDLQYKTKEGRQFLVKAESMQKDGSKITYEYGENVTGERTFSAPSGLNKNELKEYTVKYFESNVFDGYEGSLDSWGIPRTKTGDSAEITDPNYPNGYRNGQYFIAGVTVTIDEQSGFKRSNKLSFKIK